MQKRPTSIDKQEFKYPTSSFAGIIKDKRDFEKSSSGGAFKAIVKSVVEMYNAQYSVFYCAGVKFAKGFEVVNDVVEIKEIDDIDVFSKSKYVQSNPVGVYRKCRRILNSKSSFLVFSGTPCQIAALKTFLNKPYENLLCVDVICHGAPSQFDFDQYIHKIETQFRSHVINYQFRTKQQLDNGTFYTRSAQYRFENGIEKRVSRLEDEYLKYFYDEEYEERESCKSCIFKRKERVSDITIGDAWRIDKVYNELVPTQGISSIIIVSSSAEQLEPYIRENMKTYELDYDFMIANNEPLRRKG